MKFMYFTDPHLKGRNPARRLDDYPSEVLMFFEEAKQVAIQEELDAILIGGDIYDTPKISQRLYNKLVRILNDITCDVVVVPGNHDIFGMNADNLEDTMLASLEASGLIKLVSEDRGYVDFTDKDHNQVRIHGKEFTGQRDHGDIIEDYTIPAYALGPEWNFLMTHSMLLEKPFHPDIPHTLIKDVAPLANAEVIFGAHYHPGWDIIEEGDVTFIHPGGTARLEGTKTEASRTIQYAFLEIDANGEMEYELRPFKSARPGKDILDITTNTAAKKHKNALDVFRKQVDDAAAFEAQDPNTILLAIATAENIPNLIQNLALKAIVQAEKDSDELNVGLKGFVESTKPVALEWVELENFQAHKNTRFEFDTDGLNAIIGASDSGKTAAIRGLRWLLYNDPKGTDFIRFGESRATVRAHFSNGYTIERSRTQSSAGHYKITDPSGTTQEYTGFSHNVPIDVTNAHQMPKTQLSKDVEASLNISYQLDGPFLIGESASTRASVIGRLTGVHVVDAAIRETNKKVGNLQRDIKSDLRRDEELDERLANDFQDIPDIQDKVNQVELLLTRAEQIEKTLNELVSIEKDYEDAKSTIHQATKQLVMINTYLPQVQKALAEAETKQQQLVTLEALEGDLYNAEHDIDYMTTKLKSFRGLSKILSDLTHAEGLARDLMIHEDLQSSLETAQLNIDKATRKLNSLPSYDANMLIQAEGLLQQYKEVGDLEHEITREQGYIGVADEIIAQADSDMEMYRASYKEVLKDMGKCPTCYTPIDDTIIDKIEL